MSTRRAVKPGEKTEPRAERTGRVVRVRSLELARAVLRARGKTTQAGFTAEQIPRGIFRHHPILISDGKLHDEQRRKVAQFFAPSVLSDRYGELMAAEARNVVADAVDAGGCRLDEVALHYTVAVTARVVGLTSSPVPAMAKRLVGFFRQPPLDRTKPGLGRTRRQWMRAAVNGLAPVARFYFADVRPAIRDHRRQPRDDVIGHLLEEGYSHADILVECATYGTAGMVTTREFISMACWHLLDDERLRRRYLTAERDERIAILQEILRLEPVVGHLYRRVREDFTATENDEEVELSAGDLVDVEVRQTNTDAASVGAGPFELCPGRPLPRGVHPEGLSFSDGGHRCPGGPLAMLEADALLTRLLARVPAVASEPIIGWDDVIEGYRLRGLDLTFQRDAGP